MKKQILLLCLALTSLCSYAQTITVKGVVTSASDKEPMIGATVQVKGRVLDVAVDIRKGSPTYGKHVAVELTEDNHRQFFIPKGFAHGFAVLSETAVFQYKCDNFYHPEADGGISILDDTLCIDWRIPTEHANLSEKDTKHAMLKDFDSPFDINVDLYK